LPFSGAAVEDVVCPVAGVECEFKILVVTKEEGRTYVVEFFEAERSGLELKEEEPVSELEMIVTVAEEVNALEKDVTVNDVTVSEVNCVNTLEVLERGDSVTELFQ
jgi:hypothetical protein